MFPKNNRLPLRQQKDFFHTAQRKSFPSFQLFWKNTDEPRPQFSVIVPKKVSLKSTTRHKLLRQMRAILIKKKDIFYNKQVVVVMFRSSLRKSFEELETEVLKVSKSA